MATVWKATQHGTAGFKRPVAIKRIKEQVALEPKFVELFVEEARVCAELVHPNVVQIYDFGTDEMGRHFIVMEWVEGLSLSQFTQVLEELGIPTPWPLVAGVAIEALRALAAAHDRVNEHGQPSPIYHRDVTPQNILLAKSGVVKLTDFGLARATDRSRMTAPETIKGKVGYLAPEMTRSAQPSRQTDIYSLGVVMWQALTGRKLFQGNDPVEIFAAAVRGDIPPISDFRSDVPLPFITVVERALAHDPVDRFQTAQQMSRVLANLLRSLEARPDEEFIRDWVVRVLHFLKTGELPPEGSAGPPSVGW
jgi:serine/threonine-protein kinase